MNDLSTKAAVAKKNPTVKDLRVCALDGCGRTDGISRGWCAMHYRRWRKHGHPGPVGSLLRESGLACDVTGCTRPNHGGGYCSTHLTRVRTTGSPGVARGTQYARGKSAYNWRPDDAVRYSTMHMRLRAEFGSANNHKCVDCGETSAEWSYNHTDPNERTGQTANGHTVLFSVSTDHYSPRCARCHRQFDAQQRKAA